ncbi:hypothetical protein E0Z10_g6914 [Xylaria hypoxylon]|uniref:Uncharacterized protein n=1 Tax=Xylaria hypoxylon TaxID=37992 RepID=A0A4Z0YP83_9PEZI|nr:hypothetical protein E0Z10_g6914 [Xylaria hypoxylon]
MAIVVPNNAQNTRAEPCARILEKSDQLRVNVKKEEARQHVAEHRPKTLKDSRWAREDLPPVHTKVDKKKPNRSATKPRPKTPKESRWAKIESLHDPLRVQMDMEEFKKDVAKYGLKTLKDSRWAD